MIVKAKIGEDGSIKIENPALYGKDVEIHVNDVIDLDISCTFNWDKLKEAMDQADQLDIPRKTHAEIMTELKEIRG